jgi:hypothetical protein
VVARFGEAKAAAGELDRYRQARKALGSLGATPGIGAVIAGTEYTRVPDTMVAEAVTAARPGMLGLWGAWLSIDGVELTWWRSIGEHKQYANTVPRAEVRHRRTGRGIYTPEKVIVG